MYSGYQALAGVYDCLNREIDYGRWSAFLEACFDRFLPARPRIVLDLACGTGRMTFPLADRGYDMIGIDGSEDMLAEAYRKSTERTIRLLDEAGTDELPAGVTTPLFLCQDMRSFELYGTVDAAVCCLDSINYLCGDGDLDACLACLYLYIAPGGLLVFDVNSPVTFDTGGYRPGGRRTTERAGGILRLAERVRPRHAPVPLLPVGVPGGEGRALCPHRRGADRALLQPRGIGNGIGSRRL